MTKLTIQQRRVLEAVPRAFLKSASSQEIASWLNEETHWIASPLRALEKKGLIACTERGGQGLPSWFCITDAGRAALAEQEGT